MNIFDPQFNEKDLTLISKGGFSKIYLLKKENKEYAIKKLTADDDEILNQLSQEITFL
jgi:hypothetical protein